MKVGIRKPNLKSRIKARTTGKIKRKVKKATNPLYGKKGMGLLHPKKALYNKVYRKTTVKAFGSSSHSFSFIGIVVELLVLTFLVSIFGGIALVFGLIILCFQLYKAFSKKK